MLLEGLLKSEIQILPSRVIDAVFLYVRQKAVIDTFVKDMREIQTPPRAKDVQLLMYKDYIAMKRVELRLAMNARDTLEASIEPGVRIQ